MNPVNPCSFGEISSPFLILSKAWVTSFFFISCASGNINLIKCVQLVQQIGMKVFGTPQLRFVLISLAFTTALCGSSKTFLIHFLGCMNITLVLCQVIPPVESSFLSIITVPAFSSAISAGHSGCLSNSSSDQHSYKYNT